MEQITTSYQINALKEKIIRKFEALDSLIESLEEWERELNNKIERIKQSLRSEIRILKKHFLILTLIILIIRIIQIFTPFSIVLNIIIINI